MTTPAAGTDIAPMGTAVLVLEPRKPTFTAVQECDARGALVRGLAEYLEQLSWQAAGGRELRFKRVKQEWSAVEDSAKWPSLSLYTIAPGAYDASKFTPEQIPTDTVPDGRFVVSYADMVVDIVAEVWCTDVKERSQFTAMLENAFNPVMYRYGFNLDLPFYFGQRGDYSVQEVTIEDAEDDAHRRIRKAMFSVNAIVPVTKLVALPLSKPKFKLEAVSSDVDVLVRFITESL